MAKAKKKAPAGKAKTAAKPKVAPKAAKKPAAKGKRASWLDPQSNTPLIDQYARRLKSFMAAIADGEVDDAELDAQEKRLVDLMKEIEPQLEPALHARVTELLCELTAYDIMQMLNAMQSQRPQTVFRG